MASTAAGWEDGQRMGDGGRSQVMWRTKGVRVEIRGRIPLGGNPRGGSVKLQWVMSPFESSMGPAVGLIALFIPGKSRDRGTPHVGNPMRIDPP